MKIAKMFSVIVMVMMLSSAAIGETIDIKVKGLVCDFCARTIQKSFERTGSVEKVDVDLGNGSVVVETKPGKELSDERIRGLVTDAGYNMVSIKRS